MTHIQLKLGASIVFKEWSKMSEKLHTGNWKRSVQYQEQMLTT